MGAATAEVAAPTANAATAIAAMPRLIKLGFIGIVLLTLDWVL